MKLSKLFYNVKKLDDKKIYTLLGLKFSKRRDLYKAGKDIENVFNYARINMDIEKLPAATGILRKIQLANVKILQEIDRVCNENNLKYWIDFGTLIGAVRHKGYVPWDDDIDICMMREDYDKILNIFNKNTKHPELEAVLHMHKDGTSNIIKVVHKDSPALWIDIFPYDYYHSKLDFNGKKEVTAKIKKTLDNNTLRPKNADPAEFRKRFLPMRDKHILDGKIPDKTIHPALFLGLDFYHRHRDLCCDYESIFPLKKIKFEGVSLPCPNDPDYILTARYGDYMTLPKKLHFHTELGKIDLRENLEIKRFLGERK